MSDLILFNRDKNRYPGGGLYILTLIYEATPPSSPPKVFYYIYKKKIQIHKIQT